MKDFISADQCGVLLSVESNWHDYKEAKDRLKTYPKDECAIIFSGKGNFYEIGVGLTLEKLEGLRDYLSDLIKYFKE